MTVRMDNLMKQRDLLVADFVRQREELGYFDTQFLIYGGAYWTNNGPQYIVSAQEDKVHCALEAVAHEGRFPTVVVQMDETVHVPFGMKEDYLYRQKIALLKRLRRIFPEAYFQQLLALRFEQNDAAAPIFTDMMQQLDGMVSRRYLHLFIGLVEYAYASLKLSDASYHAISEWVRASREEMLYEDTRKDQFGKTFHGFAYLEGESIRHYFTATLSDLMRKKQELILSKRLVSPTYSKECWYNFDYTLKDVRKDFKRELESYLNATYMATIRAIVALPCGVNQASYLAVQQALETNGYAQEAIDSFTRMGWLWHVESVISPAPNS